MSSSSPPVLCQAWVSHVPVETAWHGLPSFLNHGCAGRCCCLAWPSTAFSQPKFQLPFRVPVGNLPVDSFQVSSGVQPSWACHHPQLSLLTGRGCSSKRKAHNSPAESAPNLIPWHSSGCCGPSLTDEYRSLTQLSIRPPPALECQAAAGDGT